MSVDTSVLSKFFELPFARTLLHSKELTSLYHAYYSEDFPSFPFSLGVVNFGEVKRAVSKLNPEVPRAHFSFALKTEDVVVFGVSDDVVNPAEFLEKEREEKRFVRLPVMPAVRGVRIEGPDLAVVGYREVKPKGEIGSFFMKVSDGHFLCGNWIADCQKGEVFSVYVEEEKLRIEEEFDDLLLEELSEVLK